MAASAVRYCRELCKQWDYRWTYLPSLFLKREPRELMWAIAALGVEAGLESKRRPGPDAARIGLWKGQMAAPIEHPVSQAVHRLALSDGYARLCLARMLSARERHGQMPQFNDEDELERHLDAIQGGLFYLLERNEHLGSHLGKAVGLGRWVESSGPMPNTLVAGEGKGVLLGRMQAHLDKARELLVSGGHTTPLLPWVWTAERYLRRQADPLLPAHLAWRALANK